MSLVEDARRLAPELTAAAAEGDRLRRLPDATWKALLEGGFLRALQPARWGGSETTLREFVDAVFEISRANPSAGWVAGVVGVHPWQLALFDELAQEEMWGADPATMHSSSYNPTGGAEQVEGGFRVTGRWSFSSGSDHCSGVNLGAMVRGHDGPPLMHSLLLHPGQYRIEDNWHVAGLRGTGSKDIVVEDAFVPEHRAQAHARYGDGSVLPGQALNDGPLYRLPWSVVFTMALGTSVLGAAQGFVDLWTAETAGRNVRGRAMRDDTLTHTRLAEAVYTLDAARTLMQADAERLWAAAVARTVPSMADRGRVRWNVTRGCELAGEAVNRLFHAASGRSIYLDHPLQTRYQDVQGALGHAFLVPDPLARSVGGALLGTTSPEPVA